MFNKSGVFGRNESANSNNRRDPAAGASATPSVSVSPSGERLSGRPAPTVKDAVPTTPAVEASPPAVPAAASEAIAAIGGDAIAAPLYQQIIGLQTFNKTADLSVFLTIGTIFNDLAQRAEVFWQIQFCGQLTRCHQRLIF